MTQSAALAAVQARTDELAMQGRFSGALLIARHGKILLEKTWGLADRDAGKPVKADTQFRLGSMNKMFTGVAILQLAEAGKVSLQGTVGTYLPDYPNRDVAEKVTLRELLNHTGGTGDIWGPEFNANRITLKENADYLKLYGSRGLDYEPGKEVRYSNYGFVLLGAVIERVSGMSYYDYVNRYIFKPANMRSSASPAESTSVPARAVGYMKVNGAWVDNRETLPYRGMAAGGGCSTVGDLFNFAQALERGKLLSPESLHEATEPQNNAGWYGYGFMVAGEGPLHNFGHEGASFGMDGTLRIFPELGVVIVALSNLDPPAADRLVDYYSLRMPSSP
jgi:CubicO group peptidase (beta-lactamase class C family)